MCLSCPGQEQPLQGSFLKTAVESLPATTVAAPLAADTAPNGNQPRYVICVKCGSWTYPPCSACGSKGPFRVPKGALSSHR